MALLRAEFLSLDTSDIWGWIIIFVGDCIQFSRETEPIYEELAHVKEAEKARWGRRQMGPKLDIYS